MAIRLRRNKIPTHKLPALTPKPAPQSKVQPSPAPRSAVRFSKPTVLKPAAAALLALLLYGVFAAWHVWKTWEYPDLIVAGLLVIGAFGCVFVWLTAFLFPRLKKWQRPWRKWTWRGAALGSFLFFITAGALIEVSWETLVKDVLLAYWDKRAESWEEWRSAVRTCSRPLKSAAWLTCSLFSVAVQFFRPDPPPKKPPRPRPPPLPIAEGMKSRVVTDKWWEKYN